MNKDNPYGYCPICGSPGKSRERRPNGNDKCHNGHTYPSHNATNVADWQKQEANGCELLRWAAKAVGYHVIEERSGGLAWTVEKEDGRRYPWNPRDNDGDAMRLAVKLGMFDSNNVYSFRVFLEPGQDPYYATRIAIIRVAALVGRAME